MNRDKEEEQLLHGHAERSGLTAEQARRYFELRGKLEQTQRRVSWLVSGAAVAAAGAAGWFVGHRGSPASKHMDEVQAAAVQKQNHEDFMMNRYGYLVAGRSNLEKRETKLRERISQRPQDPELIEAIREYNDHVYVFNEVLNALPDLRDGKFETGVHETVPAIRPLEKITLPKGK